MHVFRPRRISGHSGVSCAFFGRGPVDRPDPVELASRLLPPGLAAPRVVTLRQVHSARVLAVGTGASPVAGDGDALVTAEPGVALGVATADCVPLALYDPGVPAVGVVHAGWRGTVAGVLPAAIAEMIRSYGSDPARLLVAAGPAAGPCCYQVGEEVSGEFRRRHPSHAERILREDAAGGGRGKALLNLIEANRLQALDAGVSPGNFEPLDVCTVCRPDLCHSYRRDGKDAGRMWLLAALSPPSS